MTTTTAPPVADINDQAKMFDLGAERYVLGAMMLSEQAADDILDTGLAAEHFYRPIHGLIYTTIMAALARNEPAEPVALAAALAATDDLARIGGAPYLHTLYASPPTAATGPYYARIVYDHARRRLLAEASVRIAQIARSPSRDIAEAIDMAQSVLHAATVTGAHTTMQPMSSLADDILEEVLADTGVGRGISTGLASLDDIIGGLKPGQLIIVAGRPGAGKSVAVMDIARHTAVTTQIPTGVFSLEMTKAELVRRLYAAHASVDLTRIVNGNLTDADRERLRAVFPAIRRAPLFIDDNAPMTLAMIRSGARRLQQRRGLGLLIVDYVQLVRATVARESRVQEVTEVSTGLKLLAKELAIPIVAACQLNRNSESRSDRRPGLADLRESGSLEQDSDVVVLLHRPDYHDHEHLRAGEIDLIVAKNRHGANDTATAAAQLHYARIVDFAPDPAVAARPAAESETP